MNPLVAENEFRRGMERILAEIGRLSAPEAANPNAWAKGESLHEHDTRAFFFDRLLQLLGWNLGAGGDVAEEARIKAGTTNFVDYVGVDQDTRAPVLIVEAKAWDKPIIKGKGEKRDWSKPKLIVEAIKHVNARGGEESSPVTAEWHGHLSQLARYVRTFKEQYGHSVSRAVLSSGQWLLVFTDPVLTFCEAKVNDQQFRLFESGEYVERAHVIFQQLARVTVADPAPIHIRPSELVDHVNKENFVAAYHGMLIRYEESGFPTLAQSPRILIYPALIIQRNDDKLFTVIDSEVPVPMQTSRNVNGEEIIGPHLAEVATAAKELLQSCSEELDLSLAPGELADFPGFPTTSVVDASGVAPNKQQKQFVKPVRNSSENWLAVTGSQTHYLHEIPKVACRFNAWAACDAIGRSIGPNAINSPATREPRAFFVDGQPHHCAHRTVADRRSARCYIEAIDARTCCSACVYHGSCWSPAEAAKLPCGN